MESVWSPLGGNGSVFPRALIVIIKVVSTAGAAGRWKRDKGCQRRAMRYRLRLRLRLVTRYAVYSTWATPTRWRDSILRRNSIHGISTADLPVQRAAAPSKPCGSNQRLAMGHQFSQRAKTTMVTKAKHIKAQTRVSSAREADTPAIRKRAHFELRRRSACTPAQTGAYAGRSCQKRILHARMRS